MEPRRVPMMQRGVPYVPQTRSLGERIGSALYPKGYGGGLFGAGAWLDNVQAVDDTIRAVFDDALYQGASREGAVQAALEVASEMYRRNPDILPQFDPSNLGAMVGKIVYHGTPHKWLPEPGFPKGRPRLDKVMTGEGTNAQGFGFYSAELPDTGTAYMNQLVDRNLRIHTTTDRMLKKFKNFGFDSKNDALSYMQENLSDWREKLGVSEKIDNWDKKIIDRDLKKNSFSGKFYKLDIPDEAIDMMIDWDAPLSTQPEVLKKIKKATRYRDDIWRWEKGLRGPDIDTGQDLMYALKAAGPRGYQAQRMAHLFREQGITGVKYLDAGSRAGFLPGESPGTRNYVVWDQDVLDKTKMLND